MTQQGPRAQIDRKLYKKHMQSLLFNYPSLEVRAGSVFDLLFDDSDVGNPWGKVVGVKLGMCLFNRRRATNQLD